MTEANTVQTSPAAIISLVFGILAWLALPLIGAVIAIVTGHIARGEIRREPARLEGDGLAVAGLVLGWVQLVLSLVVILLLVLIIGIPVLMSHWNV